MTDCQSHFPEVTLLNQGIAEGLFVVENPRVAAWFVLGGLHMLEVGFPDPTELLSAITHAMECVLSALGYTKNPRTPQI